MGKNDDVLIEAITGVARSYLIKDSSRITIGKFFIVELDKESKRCTIRLKFFRNNNYGLLLKSIEELMEFIYDGKKINKLNIYVAEDVKFNAFLDLGFTLEGIIEDNVIINNIPKNELLFGITLEEYRIKEQKMPLVKIQGKNIELRNLTLEHKKEITDYYIRNKEHLREFEPIRDKKFYTEEGQHDLLIESYKLFIKGQCVDLGIFKNDKFIGILKISNIILGVFKSAIIGYSIDEMEKRKGYMKEAVRLAITYGFNELGLHRIEASAMTSNIASQKVLESCEFKKVGINESYLFINGKWRDHITYCKINKKEI